MTIQAAGAYDVEPIHGGLQVQVEGNQPVAMQVTVPNDSSIEIQTFDGNVSLDRVGGEVTVRSTAGNITAKGLTGRIELITARGDITVTDSAGEVRLLGEHGVLSMGDVHGVATATTIMGAVHYAGAPTAGDDIQLETDHGPVEVWLSQNTNATVNIVSTNGLITCRLGTLVGSMGRCSGQMGAGEGTFHVRTVSGPVTLSPEHELLGQ